MFYIEHFRCNPFEFPCAPSPSQYNEAIINFYATEYAQGPSSPLASPIRPQSLICTLDSDFVSELIASGAPEAIAEVWQSANEGSSKPVALDPSVLDQCEQAVNEHAAYYDTLPLKELVDEWKFISAHRRDCVESKAYIEGLVRASKLSLWQKATLPIGLLKAIS